MAEVELVIKADGRQVITTLKEISNETEKNYHLMEKNNKDRIGLIEKEERILKNLLRWKKKATTEELALYNQEIEKSIERLKAYETVGTQANEKIEKSGDSLLGGVKSWAMGFATLGAAVSAFKFIVASTDALSDKFAATLNGWKEGFSAMARAIANNDFKDFFKNVKEAVKEGQRYAETEEKISDATRAAKFEIEDNLTKIQDLRIAQQNKLKTDKEQIAIGEEILKYLQRNSDLELKIAEDTLENDLTNAAFKAKTSKEIVEAYLRQDKALMKNIELGKQYNDLQTQLEKTVTVINTGTTSATIVDKKAAEAIEAKIDAMAPEGKLYSELEKNLVSVIDVQKDKIQSDAAAIESAKRAGRNLRVENSLNADLAAGKKAANEKILKDQNEFQKLSAKLLDDSEKTAIEALTGKEKLEAQRDYGIKQIKEVRDTLSKLGPLSEEQLKQLQILADNVWKEYSDALAKEAKSLAPQEVILDVEIKTQEDILKGLKEQLTLQPENEQIKKQIDEIEANIARLEKEKITISVELKETISTSLELPELPGIQKMTQNTAENIKKQLEANAAAEPFSMWKLLGINPEDEEGQKTIDNFRLFADTTIGILDETFARKVEIAQRERELLDTQIAESQRALELEQQLAEDGYASNVALKQKELDRLKKQREKALIEEEKAIKRQQQLDTVMQISSLITASANIIKGFSTMPVIGQVLAIAAIVAMFAAFASAKTQAAAATKLEEGASGTETGIITGKRHAQGGERFLDHVEVEEGEQWGVLSRKAAGKYGKAFHEIVMSFNKDKKPVFIENLTESIIDEHKKSEFITNLVNSIFNEYKKAELINDVTKLDEKKKSEFASKLINSVFDRYRESEFIVRLKEEKKSELMNSLKNLIIEKDITKSDEFKKSESIKNLINSYINKELESVSETDKYKKTEFITQLIDTILNEYKKTEFDIRKLDEKKKLELITDLTKSVTDEYNKSEFITRLEDNKKSELMTNLINMISEKELLTRSDEKNKSEVISNLVNSFLNKKSESVSKSELITDLTKSILNEYRESDVSLSKFYEENKSIINESNLNEQKKSEFVNNLIKSITSEAKKLEFISSISKLNEQNRSELINNLSDTLSSEYRKFEFVNNMTNSILDEHKNYTTDKLSEYAKSDLISRLDERKKADYVTNLANSILDEQRRTEITDIKLDERKKAEFITNLANSIYDEYRRSEFMARLTNSIFNKSDFISSVSKSDFINEVTKSIFNEREKARFIENISKSIYDTYNKSELISNINKSILNEVSDISKSDTSISKTDLSQSNLINDITRSVFREYNKSNFTADVIKSVFNNDFTKELYSQSDFVTQNIKESSFNKDAMPEFESPVINNSVRIDNNGPNSRLDRVIKEQEKMNTNLHQGQLITTGNKRIIKSGNKIRIIG